MQRFKLFLKALGIVGLGIFVVALVYFLTVFSGIILLVTTVYLILSEYFREDLNDDLPNNKGP